jgi:hypothetical protein
MKKILFVVYKSGYDVTGLNLFINHPYGQEDGISWEVVIGDENFFTKKKHLFDSFLNNFSVIYNIRNSSEIETHLPAKDSIYINSLNDDVLSQCDFINTSIVLKPNSIQDKEAENERTITLFYQKTNDFSQDASRIRNDFYNIVYQTVPNVTKKEIFELDRTIYPAQCELLDLHPIRLTSLTESDKEGLNLAQESEYVWDTLQDSSNEYRYSIYRNIQQLLHVQCYP